MKKKVIGIGTFFLLVISFFICTAVTIQNHYKAGGSTPSFSINAGQRYDALAITGTFKIHVGEEFSFDKEFMPYVKPEEKATMKIEIEDESVLYLTDYKFKVIGLKAGESKIIVSSDKYYSEITIQVELENLCVNGDFTNLAIGTTWEEMNQTVDGWRLYTGNQVVDPQNQIVEIIEEEGNHIVHYQHLKTAYSTLYKTFNVGPGQYYVKARMKGKDVEKDTYVRINNDNKNKTLTDMVKGTFDWTEFTSNVFRIEESDSKPLKIELYCPNNTGEVWFDDIEIYRVITPDQLSISVENMAEDLEVGETLQLRCHTNPESIVDYNYKYEVQDSEIADVSVIGEVTGKKAGITKVIITDLIFGYQTEVTIIVGKRNGIQASIDGVDSIVKVKEDSSIAIPVSVDNTEQFQIIKYRNASFGDYYIKNHQIIYSPKRDVFTLNNEYDSFKVVVFNQEKGYQILEITVDIEAVFDECIETEFWLTTPKNQGMIWETTVNNNNYSACGNYDNSKKDLLYNGGYVQITCSDIEILYPQKKRSEMTGNEKNIREAKALLYGKIQGILKSTTTTHGGTVELVKNGYAQEIQDRYYSSTGKIIHGILFNYTPKENFYGYDTFDIVIKNGDVENTITVTVYVLPDVEDFKFDQLNLDGTYLLSNDAWLEDVRNGYNDKDPYITKWVEFYEKNLAGYTLKGIPSEARSAVEQFAILYQITNKKEYAELCWQQLERMVWDEEWTGDGRRRGSWGEDSNGFLDAAMVTYSVAFAYNYIKDTLKDNQKEIIIKALYEEGFYYFENLNNVNVLLHGNNHCLLICGNLALAALSTLSYQGEIEGTVKGKSYHVDVQKMSAEVVITAFRFLQNGLVHYSDSGGFPEGPAYSIYAHRNIVSLLATLRNLYGEENGKINSFGLSDIEGIMNYINYPLYSSSPNHESFYYAESEYSNNQPALLWYTRIDESNTNAAILSKLADDNEQYNIMSLLWYTPGLFDKINLHAMEKLDYLLEEHELATFRSAFGDEMAIFTGLKGVNITSGSFAHKNLDSGTFEIYALGERFIGNFCNETYNIVVPNGFWDYDYQRWTYYKKNAQGQNTLVFNPEKNPVLQQDPNANAPIVKFDSNQNGGYSIVNLSDVYKTDVLSAYRGLKLFDNRTKIMLQDEFELRDESTIYWSAHTEAKIEIISEKVARLILNGKSLYAYINSEIGSFSVMPATALPGTIGEFCNLDNEGVNKLVIRLDHVTSGTLNVVFVPTLEEITQFENYKITALNDWSLENLTALPDIAVENITMNTEFGDKYKYVFNPYQYQYVVKLDKTVKEVPNLDVSYDKTKYKVTIEKSKTFNSATKVIVEDIATKETRTYTYRFLVDTIIDGYEEYTLIPVVNVVGTTGVANLIDGNNKTTFTSENREVVIFEFEKETTITNVLMRFSGGLLNTYYFDIYYSLDGETWTTCYFGGQSTNNMGDEVYSLGFVEAKYMKIVFNGNNHDDKTTLSRVEFYHNNYKPQKTNNVTALPIILSCVGGAAIITVLVVLTIILTKKRSKKDEKTITNDSSNGN